MLGMTGLAFMQGVLDGTLPAPPIGKTLNYRVTDVAPGAVTFEGSPTFDHCNPIGTVHGGWYGTLLDSCMACAVMTMLEKGTGYTTLEYKVNITRTVPLGMQVAARGVVQHMGRSTGVANGELRGVEDGKLYATGSTTCIVLRP
ncbi:thioesterase [Pseudaestuariivita atlantica]|uniref:Thioesterase n=2 Tax=Pseudaestuariivita atlantica TaxID=1317121 RepID=A0A0L1JLS4_9RHOB|nr:PaaI family thioesterase [Pseudaestuariivita atlantica]KNG92701.1 thioesterase [Pseudaestuariivita atlantica]